jgi:hypothetical protein
MLGRFYVKYTVKERKTLQKLNKKKGMLFSIYSIAENDMDLAEVEPEEEPEEELEEELEESHIFTLFFTPIFIK